MRGIRKRSSWLVLAVLPFAAMSCADEVGREADSNSAGRSSPPISRSSRSDQDASAAHPADPETDAATEDIDAGMAPADAGSSSDASTTEPELLSATGLYAGIEAGALRLGVRTYNPQGVLWADGSDKMRWIYLPPNTQIDTSDMDEWVFPVGTKLWKQFSSAGKRIETRLLEKRSDATWRHVSFLWNDDQRDAVAVPKGVKNAAGTEHDVPSERDCTRCHNGVSDAVIGFSAVQLSHDGPGLTINEAVAADMLSAPPSAAFTIPGDSTQRAALLYLHANCASCHNDRTFIANVTSVDFALRVATLASVSSTNAYRTLQRDLRRSGDVDKTATLVRMRARGVQGQMPPIASERVDSEGLLTVRTWLESPD